MKEPGKGRVAHESLGMRLKKPSLLDSTFLPKVGRDFWRRRF
jgi:hypothetical protein